MLARHSGNSDYYRGSDDGERYPNSRSVWVQEPTEVGEGLDVPDKPGCLSLWFYLTLNCVYKRSGGGHWNYSDVIAFVELKTLLKT